MCENYMQSNEYQEGNINAPSISQVSISKKGAILQKTDSSSSSNSSQNDINDTYSAVVEEGRCVNDKSSSGMA